VNAEQESKGGILPIIAGVALMGASVTALVLWHRQNQLLYGHDSHAHLAMTMRYADALGRGWPNLREVMATQTAQHLPLFYLVTGAIAAVADRVLWPLLTVIVVFWASAVAAMLAVGNLLFPKRWVALLPMLALLANPTFWETGQSYNYETLMTAATCLLLLIFLTANKMPRWLYGLMLPAAAVLCLTKSVLLLPVLSLAVVLIAAAEPVDRKRLIWLTLVCVAVFAVWLFFRRDAAIREITMVVGNQTGFERGKGYFIEMLLGPYRGLVLLLALGWLVVRRLRRRRLSGLEVALAVYFLAPLALFSFLDNKWPWYLVAGYAAAPVWYLAAAKGERESAWVRRITAGLLVVYGFFALANVGVAATLSHKRLGLGEKYAGMLQAEPPQPLERDIAHRLTARLDEDPQARIVVDCSQSPVPERRLTPIIFLDHPRLVVGDQIAIAHNLSPFVESVIDVLPQANWFYTFGDAWPQPDPARFDLEKPNQRKVYQTIIDAEALFAKQRQVGLPDGTPLSEFRRIIPSTEGDESKSIEK